MERRNLVNFVLFEDPIKSLMVLAMGFPMPIWVGFERDRNNQSAKVKAAFKLSSFKKSCFFANNLTIYLFVGFG